MKHTPAPWNVKQFDFDEVENSDGRTVARCFKNQNSSVEDMKQNIAANARLIAAAPDLLAACRTALGSVESVCEEAGDACARCLLVDAIAKAEGKE